MNANFDGELELARRLRRSSTEAEKKLWAHLRNRQLCELKFKRQVPVCGFYADFLCQSAKLIVEVDGGQHAIDIAADGERTRTLEAAGFHVLRFWNSDVMGNLQGVLTEIANTIKVASPHPSPLPQGEGVQTVEASSPLPQGEGVQTVEASSPLPAEERVKARAASLPLPGGEGQGEGLWR